MVVKVNDVIIKQVQSVKYLGVWMDQHLSWQEQIKYTSKKIAARLALLSARLLGNALVLPYFDYCCNAWTNCNQRNRSILIKQHKQMARIILKANPLTPSSQMFKTLHWIPMEERWRFHRAKLLYDVINGSAPSYLIDRFTLCSSTHRYRTRRADTHGLVLPRVTSESGKRAFSFSGAMLWNALPAIIRSSPSKATFCCNYLKHFAS